MAEYVDGSEKAPLQAPSAGDGRRAPPQKPDWTRFGLSGGDGQPAAGRKPGEVGDGDGAALTRSDEDAGEVNEIYAEHQVRLRVGTSRLCLLAVLDFCTSTLVAM